MYATASWAPNQSGCGTEEDFPFNENSDECLDGWSTDFYCVNEDGDETTSYGGGYVLEPPGGGCILIELYATSSSSKKRLIIESDPKPFSVDTITARVFNASNWRNGTISVWPVSNDTSKINKAHLFNASAIALLLNSSISEKR